MAAEKGRSWVKWLIGGCAGLLLLGTLGAMGLVWTVMQSMTGSGAYQEAVSRVQAHPEAIAALGEPIKPGFMVSGSVSVEGPSGRAELAIPVRGPRAKGKLYVEATKRADRWAFGLLELQVEGGDRIDLTDSEE